MLAKYQRWLIALSKLLLLPLAIIILYLCAVLILGQWRINMMRTDTSSPIAIYVVSNGIHTDIVMPIYTPQWNWRKWVRESDTRTTTPAQYVGIGWGDRRFYLETPNWSDLKASTAIKAISGLNPSALHVTFHANTPDIQQPQVAKIMLSETQYQQLSQQIATYFVQQQGQAVVIRNAAYGDTDAFYEAIGRYNLFMTCNTWTNLQLKNSGAPALMWTPFASQLMRALRSH